MILTQQMLLECKMLIDVFGEVLFVMGITRRSTWLPAQSVGDRLVSTELLQPLSRLVVWALANTGKCGFEVAKNVFLAAITEHS